MSAGDTVQIATECSEEDWTRIKAKGRQGVMRAYEEGGARKAKIKLAKMLAAADGAPAPADSEGAVTNQTLKKRRRRNNARERTVANARGHLTAAQACLLYVSQFPTWHRIKEWISPLEAQRRHPERKQQLKAHFHQEMQLFSVCHFDHVCMKYDPDKAVSQQLGCQHCLLNLNLQAEFASYCDKGSLDYALFVSVVTQAKPCA